MTDLAALEDLWDGFFEDIRNRRFSEQHTEAALQSLQSIDCDKEHLSKKLVSMIWIIPLFLDWNKDRCIENGASEQSYTKFSDQITEVVIEKLGVP